MKSCLDEDPEINVDSLWIIGPRAKGGKRENSYHGNFVPQIPSDFIRRFTKEGDVVLEPFAGSGTTLFECERLKRKYIGFDINKDRACQSCIKSAIRPPLFGIRYWYEGDSQYRGTCRGCGYFDGAEWRRRLNAKFGE